MAYTLIASQTLLNPTATVTFSGIPGIYRDLILESNIGNTENTTRDIRIQFNNDTATNYSSTFLTGTGTAAQSSRDSNFSFIRTWGSSTSAVNGLPIFQIMSYANTSINKSVLSRGNVHTWIVGASIGLWRSTAAITSITITNEGISHPAGSTFKLWGVY